MRSLAICTILLLGPAAWAQSGDLKTADQVFDRYKKALGGEEAIRKVHSETIHAEVERTGLNGKITVVSYSKPFQGLNKAKRPDGTEVVSGFDGHVSWSITPQGASIDKDTPVEADRRDSDLQYALHQPDYFKTIELAGITDFEGKRCYWLHGITHWGKDNNQFYDVETGLLAGYRFQTDSKGSSDVTIMTFEDYKNFGGPMVPTKMTARTGTRTMTFRALSVSYEPLDDSLFELPDAVKTLLKQAN